MPLHRRNSTGQVEGDYLEEITETAELEDDQLQEITCSAPKVRDSLLLTVEQREVLQDFLCLRGAQGENIFDVSRSVKLICTNPLCTLNLFMHTDCFEVWQNSLLSRLNKSKEGQKKLRHWSEKQKLQNLWKQQQGYNLVSEACACKCGEGTVRKHLNWVPPKSNSSGECRLHLYSCVSLSNIVPSGPNSDSEKQKRRRKKSNKNSKPALTIGLPTFVNGLQVKCKLDNNETITILPCRW